MKRILILAVTVALSGCGPAEQPKPDTKADNAAIDKVRDDFTAAFNAGDAAKVADFYAETAVLMDSEQPTATGHAAIMEHNKGLFDQFAVKISISPSHTTISGDLAVDEGTFKMAITPKAAGGKPLMDEGRYVVVLQRQKEGNWKVIDDIGNRSKVAAPPPAAPAKRAAAKTATSKAPASKTKTKGK